MLLQSIDLAKNQKDITQEELYIISARWKSVLINNDTTWEKTTTDNFDVTMGSFDCVQIADQVGIYILDTLGRFINSNSIGIYDGLISIPNGNRSLTSKIQKKVIRTFEYMGLKIKISSNFKIVNFFAITLNLNDNSYKLFSKINTIPTYINVSSNHTTSIIKQISNAIYIRINRLSSSKNIFNNPK